MREVTHIGKRVSTWVALAVPGKGGHPCPALCVVSGRKWRYQDSSNLLFPQIFFSLHRA